MILLMGVTDPLGGINTLFPLFGIANQLLAAIALTLVFTVLIKKRMYKWCWIPGVPLVWDLVVTLTASYQKIFSSVPAIGYWAQHNAFKTAQESGAQKFGTASSPEAIAAVVRNTFIQGTLSIIFATLVILVVIAAAIVCVRSIRAGGLPTSEEPDTPSHTFAPRGFVATPEEKKIEAQWAEITPARVPHGAHH
jgi:carbon starvation protein